LTKINIFVKIWVFYLCFQMRLLILFFFLFTFSGCSFEEEAPSEEMDAPPDYIVSFDEENQGEEDEGDEASSGSDEEGELFECREQNAEISLELDALKRKVVSCQKELSEKSSGGTPLESLSGLKSSHLQLVREALIGGEQVEFPFRTCGRMAVFFRNSWYDSFSEQLQKKKIRFANGFLEPDDLFGGCQSDAGKVAFFLGAEREEFISFMIIKYNIAEKTLEPALMLDDASSAVVTEFGKRNGAFVKFPADDGRVFRYYYDANIVVESPQT
jgi:hypothetical protein